MKLAIIGGGSSYTPELIEGLIIRNQQIPASEVVLVDVPEGREKLDIILALCRRMFEKAGLETQVSATDDRREALRGCSYVITQIRVGRLAARIQDEAIPTRHDTLGQETTGAGGFAKALRTIPVILDIARDMEAVCPDAWLINFTNPSGIVTEAVLKQAAIRCMGLCNAPINMYRSLVKQLQLSESEVAIRYVGLNHLSWISRIWVHGRDWTEALYHDENFVRYVAAMLGTDPVNEQIARITRLIPSYYLNYFYHTRDLIEKDKQALADGSGTRGEQVRQVEQELFQIYADPEVKEKPAQLAKRGGALYSEAALSLIQSIHNHEGRMHIVNVMNQGAISDLPADGVVETNCLVDRSGAKPIASGPLPQAVSGLARTIKTYEQLTIEAAVSGSRDLALEALLVHPLVPDAKVAAIILDELLAAHKNYLPAFFPGG